MRGPVRIDLRRSGGFTVVESLMALVVLSIGLLSFAATIPMMKKDLVDSDHLTRSVFLAQQSAEWLHGLTFEDPLLDEGNHEDPNYAVAGYTRSWAVQNDDPVPNVKKVTVTVARIGDADESATMIFLHAEAGR